jgi:stage III sporulation protein AF
MDRMAVWLKSVIAAVMLAGFLEMLLPNNELRGVTRLVMGLLILLILLQPLFQLFHLPVDLLGMVQNQTAAPSGVANTEQVIQKGLKIRNDWQNQFAEERRQLLREKLTHMLQLIDEIKIRKVDLTYATDQLKKVTVTVQPRKREESFSVWQAEVKYKIINAVQLICDIKEEQVEVVWNE